MSQAIDTKDRPLFIAYIRAMELNAEPTGAPMVTETMNKDLMEKLTTMSSAALYSLLLEMKKCLVSDPSFQGQKEQMQYGCIVDTAG